MSNVGGLLLVAVQLVTVHQIDGRAVDINPKQVVRLIHPGVSGVNKQMPDEVHCVIFFVDGKYLSVAETCAEVRALLTK